MMRNDTKQLVVKAANAYLENYELKQTDLARKSGVRAEYLSSMLRSNFSINAGGGKTVEISEQYFHQLAAAIGHNMGKVYWETKATPQFTSAIAILQESKAFGDTRIIVAETGAGKSHAIKSYCRKNPTDVFKVTIGSSDNLIDIIDKIIDVIGITNPGKTKSKRLQTIIFNLRTMRSRGKRPQLIFDEAEYMKQSALCSVKEMYDHLITLCSLVMIGTPQIVETLDKLKKKNKKGIPQFCRRVKYGVRYLPKVNRNFPEFLIDIKDKELVRFLKMNCENYGELHDVLVPSMRESDRLGRELSLPLVKQVLNIQDENFNTL